MPANILEYVGRESAWHGKGIVTGRYMTAGEILSQGAMNRKVFKTQLYNSRGQKIEQYGVFGWDKDADPKADNTVYYGPCGKDYEIIYPHEGAQVLDTVVGAQGGAHYETAGMLGNGAVVWLLVNLNMTIAVRDDITIPRICFVTSHDSSIAATFKLVNERIVCKNTLDAAMAESGKYIRVKHTKNAKAKLIEATKVLAAIQSDVRSVEEKLNFLAGKKVTKECMVSVLDRLFPKSKEENGEKVSSTRRDNVLIEVLRIFEENDNNAFPEQRGSAYNLLNAITNYTDHERASKNDGRAESAMFGTGSQLKSTAFTMLMDEAESLPELVSVSPRIYSAQSWETIPDSIDKLFGTN